MRLIYYHDVRMDIDVCICVDLVSVVGLLCGRA